MRILVYGMQSSGATAFTLFMAQRPDCLALVDVLNNYAAPRMSTPLDMVVKVVATTAYPLAAHMERFRPDRVVLLLRDPHDNYQSLSNKPYRNHSGLMEEKFILFDQVFAERERFDAVIRYEDFVAPFRCFLTARGACIARSRFTGCGARRGGKWRYSWSRSPASRMAITLIRRSLTKGVAARSSGLPFHQQIGAVLADFREAQPFIERSGRVELFNMHADAATAGAAFGEQRLQQEGAQALAADLWGQGDIDHPNVALVAEQIKSPDRLAFPFGQQKLGVVIGDAVLDRWAEEGAVSRSSAVQAEAGPRSWRGRDTACGQRVRGGSLRPPEN